MAMQALSAWWAARRSAGDSVVCCVPAEVAAAWATAPDWALSPRGLVICCGSVNGDSWVAAAEEPA